MSTEDLLAEYRARGGRADDRFTAKVLSIFVEFARRVRRRIKQPVAETTHDLAQRSALAAFTRGIFERMVDTAPGAVRRVAYVIVRRTAIDASRRSTAGKRAMQVDDDVALETLADPRRDATNAIEVAEWLERARAWLSDLEWQALVLVRVCGDDLDDAARELGRTREAVHDALTRARRKLREHGHGATRAAEAET